MRGFPVPLLLLIACSTPAAIAGDLPTGDLTLSVRENSPSGEIVADLRERLQLAADERIRIVEPDDAFFSIDAAGRLITAGEIPLDHEAGALRSLAIEITRPMAPDPLRARFTSILSTSGAEDADVEGLRRSRRTVSVRIFIDNQNEPPKLLSDAFQTIDLAEIAAGRSVGLIVAMDPDRNDRLSYELVDAPTLLNIDASTGVLTIREGSPIPATSRIPATVRVRDAEGLQDVRRYSVRLNRVPTLRETSVAEPQLAVADEQPTNADSTPADVNDESPATADESPAAIVSIGVSDESPATADEAPAVTVVVAASRPDDHHAADDGPPAARTTGTPEFAAGADARGWWIVLGVCVILVLVAIVGRHSTGAAASATESEIRAGDQHSLVDDQGLPATSTKSSAPSDVVEAILTRLNLDRRRDAGDHSESARSIDPASAPAANSGSPSSDRQCVNEWMNEVLTTSGLLMEDKPTGTAMSRQRQAEEQASTLVPVVAHPLRRSNDPMSQIERDQREEFRQISRSMYRADISRYQRERMREQWMSVGATAAACLVTGGVCLLTNCFGPVSAPVGTVLLSVAASLLMNRTLYPRPPRRRSTDDH